MYRRGGMTKKGQIRAPAEVFKRASRHKDFVEDMQTGYSIPETDKRFQELLDRLEKAEKEQKT